MSQLYAVPPVPPGDASGKDEDKNEGHTVIKCHSHKCSERREGRGVAGVVKDVVNVVMVVMVSPVFV